MLDLDAKRVLRTLDRDSIDIDWTGVSGGRGLRGIATDNDVVYVASGSELHALTPTLAAVDSWQCPFLLDAHGMFVWKRMLYVTSATYDSILGFDLDKRQFTWAMNIARRGSKFAAASFDPRGDEGPLPLDKLHINAIHCNQHGMYLSGLRTGGMLHFNGTEVRMAVELPANSRDAQPFRDGVIFNDTDAGALRYTGRGDGSEDRAMSIAEVPEDSLSNAEAFDEGVVKNGFARGLCVVSDSVVAGGSSPATVSLYDLVSNQTIGSVQLARDARESLHSIATWPFE